MFLISDGQPWIDFDLEVLRQLVSVLDERLEAIERLLESHGEADWEGDTADGFCGVGFVACQQYMVATASWLKVSKGTALGCGPVHPCGNTVASIVNHAANYWKHRDEWTLGNSQRQESKTQDGLDPIVSDCDYRLTVILARLVPPSKKWRFGELVPLLIEWRDDLNAKYPRP